MKEKPSSDIYISIAKDFTKTPGGRFKKEGDFSGEEFLEKILLPAFEKAFWENRYIQVDLDGCMGYPSSFICGSFGELQKMYPNIDIFKRIQFISKEDLALPIQIMEWVD